MTQISGVTPNLFSASNTKTSKTGNQSMSVAEQFAGIMNQSAADLFGNNAGLSTDAGKISGAGSTASSTSNQTRNQERDSATMNTGKSRQIKDSKTDTKVTDISQKEQSLQSLGDDIRDQIEDTLELTEEEVTEAMEMLGLTAMDLLDTQNIVALVQELTGSDTAVELLTNDSFQQLMADVTELIGNFEQVNELSPEEFTQVVETVLQSQGTSEENNDLLSDEVMTGAEPVTDVATAASSAVSDANADWNGVQEENKTVSQSVETEAVTEEEQPQMVSTQTQIADSQMVDEENGAQQIEPEEALAWKGTEEDAGQTEQNMDQSASNQSDDVFRQKDQKHATAVNDHATYQTGYTTVGQSQAVEAQPVVTAVNSYIDVEQLMAQFEGMARTLASDAGTTIEMQLNPENLGRLFLSVSEKEGNVSATITASNEEVKEALQTQLVSLRETLQMQGIKVEAVEVTVATHEFEQNLDGNQGANGEAQSDRERQAQEQSERAGRRNLNLNELDGLSGVMSEEERLVAQMMADSGNSVDFKA